MPDGKTEICHLWQLPATEVRILQDFKEFDENKYNGESSATKNIKCGRLSNLFQFLVFLFYERRRLQWGLISFLQNARSFTENKATGA